MCVLRTVGMPLIIPDMCFVQEFKAALVDPLPPGCQLIVSIIKPKLVNEKFTVARHSLKRVIVEPYSILIQGLRKLGVQFLYHVWPYIQWICIHSLREC